MQPLAVELSLLRSLETAELRLAPGRILSARVIELMPNGRGLLSVAGAVVEARLPDQLRAGQELRLQVRAIADGRVLMSVVAHAATTPPVAVVPLPGGGSISSRAREDTDKAGQEGARERRERAVRSVAVRYHAPALGDIDLAFTLDPALLTVHVTLPPGKGLDAVQEHAEELRAALTATSDRPVAVAVLPRRDPLDVYA